MKIKEIVSDRIENELFFLSKINFDFQFKEDSNYISNALLPYLFYTNAIDNNSRIIPVFLHKREDIIRAPLFYALSIFKIYADNFINNKNFTNQSYKDKDINILALNGSVCKLKSINYTSQDIILDTGSGLQPYDFKDSEILKQKNSRTNYIKNLKNIFKDIEAYKKSIRIENNPLKLIREMNSTEFRRKNTFHGALFFSKNSKFLNSKDYKDFTINGEKFLNTIPTSKLDLKEGEMNFTRMGDRRKEAGKQINEIEEFLIFTHMDNYKGYFEIKKEKNWLDTLIFDFTDNLKDLEDVLNTIKNDYKESLNNKDIKNIFLLINEKNLNAYKTINRTGLNNTPFILNREQKKNLLSNNNFLEPKIIQCSLNELNKKFKQAEKIIKNQCSQVPMINLVDSVLKPFFEIKKRYFSFYNKNELIQKINSFEDSLKKVKSEWFPTSEFYEDFLVLFSLLKELKENLTNSKVESLKELITDTNLKTCIISYNDNEQDKQFLRNNLEPVNIEFINPRNLKHPLSDLKKYDNVFILNLNRELSYVTSLNIFPNNVYLLLDSYETKIYEMTKNFIGNISSEKVLSEVLNIEYKNNEEDPIKLVADEIQESHEFNLDVFIDSVLKSNQNNNLYNESLKEKNTESIMLFFEDGNSLKVNENNYFFIHKEDIVSLKECHVRAKDLTTGDILFLFNRDSDEFEKLIWEIAEDYPKIKDLLNLDLKWRENIREYIEKEGISIDEFRKILNREGHRIQSSQAIQTWLNNDVYQPRMFNSLVNILSELDILTEVDLEQVKEATKTVKALKTRLPSELAKIQFAELNGLEYKSNFEFPELTKKMFRFMDIKTISVIVK
jgi:hypothetical protein